MITEAHLKGLQRSSLFSAVTGLGLQNDSWDDTEELVLAKIYWQSLWGIPLEEAYSKLLEGIDIMLTEKGR